MQKPGAIFRRPVQKGLQKACAKNAFCLQIPPGLSSTHQQWRTDEEPSSFIPSQVGDAGKRSSGNLNHANPQSTKEETKILLRTLPS